MTRDMTDNQFRAALKRHGFRFVIGWIDRPADAGGNRLSVGVTMKRVGKAWKLDKRSSIAKAIREFAEFDRKKGAA